MATPLNASAHIALTPLSVEIAALVGADGARQAPTEVRLVPAGEFRARDGRPAGVSGWRMDAALGAQAIAYAAAQEDDAVVDYEHQTLAAPTNGQPAPAAGWWSAAGMQYRDAPAEQGGGLWATGLRWTERAAAMIQAGEYRYFSPVIAWDRGSGSVRAVIMGALTNRAALDGLTDLTATSALAAGLKLPQPEPTMDLAALRKALALSDDADEAAILAGVDALKAKADEADTALSALRSELDAAQRETKPDLSAYVPLAVHDETLAALRQAQQGAGTRERDQLITDALADGRIPGKATADWLRGQPIDALKAYLAGAQPIAALTRQQVDTSGKPPAADGDAYEAAYRRAVDAGRVKVFGGAQ